MKKTNYNFVIETCSPIHIGCGEEYDPTGFTVDENKQSLTVFDPIIFFSGLSPEDLNTFSHICKTAEVHSIQDMYKFMRNRPSQGRNIEVSKAFINHYTEVLGKSRRDFVKALTNFKIERTVYCSHDQRAYIPGSSIKGALRTALLNMLAKKKPLIRMNDSKYSKDLEARLLNLNNKNDLFSNDPFKGVKLSDFLPVGEVQHKIMYAVDVKKGKPDKGGGPFQLLEIIIPGSLFVGTLSIVGDSINQLANKYSFDSVNEFFSAACKQFYLKEKEKEIQAGMHINLDQSSYAFSNNIPIRLGRHCGAECMTIEKYRRIFIKNLNKTLDHSTTFWLASDSKKFNNNKTVYPFGWAKLSLLDTHTQKQYDDQENNYQDLCNKMREKVIARQKEKAIQIEKEKQIRQARIQKREEEKQQELELQKKLSEMSPEEKKLYQLNQNMLPEDQANAIYNQLEKIEPPQYQWELAKALKGYFNKNNLWDFSKLSKRQKKKRKQRNMTIDMIIAKEF